jgi:hypothetical protein
MKLALITVPVVALYSAPLEVPPFRITGSNTYTDAGADTYTGASSNGYTCTYQLHHWVDLYANCTGVIGRQTFLWRAALAATASARFPNTTPRLEL